MMEVVVTTGTIRRAELQSNQHPVLLQAGCPSPGGVPTLSLTTTSSWLPSGRVAMPLISPLMSVPQYPLSTL